MPPTAAAAIVGQRLTDEVHRPRGRARAAKPAKPMDNTGLRSDLAQARDEGRA